MKIALRSWLIENSSILSMSVLKVIASSRRDSSYKIKKETLEAITATNNLVKYKRVSYTDRQSFTKMLDNTNLQEWFMSLCANYKQCDLFFTNGNHVHLQFLDESGDQVSVRQKKAPVTTQIALTNHNRIKTTPIREDQPFEPFIRLGIMDEEGRVKTSMRHKFTQVNSFIIHMEDSIDHFFKTHSSCVRLQIIDIGCGKGYLSVAMAHYFQQKYPQRVDVIGVDSREDVIALCKKSSIDLKNISFHVCPAGSLEKILSDVKTEKTHKAIVALHACNTATDVALFKAISLKADLFFVAPCCQSEIASLINSEYLQFATKHPTLKQKICALLTDALRAALLEEQGWKVDIIEFVEKEYTPKNTLLRGRWRGKSTPIPQSAQDLLDHLFDNPLLRTLISSL